MPLSPSWPMSIPSQSPLLADVACVILCEGIHFDQMSLTRANQQEVCVLESDEPAFRVALKLGKELGLC